MSHFLSRLVDRTRGAFPLLEPLIAPRFAPDLELHEAMAEEERAPSPAGSRSRTQAARSGPTSSRAGVDAPRSEEATRGATEPLSAVADGEAEIEMERALEGGEAGSGEAQGAERRPSSFVDAGMDPAQRLAQRTALAADKNSSAASNRQAARSMPADERGEIRSEVMDAAIDRSFSARRAATEARLHASRADLEAVDEYVAGEVGDSSHPQLAAAQPGFAQSSQRRADSALANAQVRFKKGGSAHRSAEVAREEVQERRPTSPRLSKAELPNKGRSYEPRRSRSDDANSDRSHDANSDRSDDARSDRSCDTRSDRSDDARSDRGYDPRSDRGYGESDDTRNDGRSERREQEPFASRARRPLLNPGAQDESDGRRSERAQLTSASAQPDKPARAAAPARSELAASRAGTPASAAAPAREASQSTSPMRGAEPEYTVRIGQVIVRAETPVPAVSKRASERPAHRLSLAEYLKQHERGRP